jgi:type II secretory pathway component GspD/PulD (secretin)
LVPILHADSVRVYQVVQQLYFAAYFSRRGTITMLPLVKPNTMVIVGQKESVEAAKELIAKLDTEVRPDAAFQIFPLKHAASDLTAPQINQAFQNRSGYGVGLLAQVNVISDTRTNSLIALASPRDLEEIAVMIKKLDIPGSNITSLVRQFHLKNSTAANVQLILQNAITSNTSQRQAMVSLGKVDAEGNLVCSNLLYNVTILAEPQSNSLLVTAPPDAMKLLEELIQQLDRLPTAESKIKVFTLVNGDAFNLASVLTGLFQTGQTNQVATTRPGMEEGDSTLVGARFQPEIRTNSILAIGSEGDLAVAEALLLRLDAENLNNRKVFTMKLVNTPAEELALILNNHFNTERLIDTQNQQFILPQSPLEQYQKEINIVAEPVSNTLVVSTAPRHYEIIRGLIMGLDERPSMVAIDVLIAEVSCNRSKDRGVEIGLQDAILFDRALGTGSLNSIFPGLSAGNPTTNLNAGAVGAQGITSLGVPTTGTSGFSFSASSESVSIFIRALETNDRTQILSRPRMVTLHNKEAQIRVGQDVPYAGATTILNNGMPQTQTEWLENIGTTLLVTPRIMPDGMVSMAVYIERASLSEWKDISSTQQAPVVNTTNTRTQLNAMDG